MAVTSKAAKPSGKGGAQLDASGEQFSITLSDKATTVVPSDPAGQVVFGAGGVSGKIWDPLNDAYIGADNNTNQNPNSSDPYYNNDSFLIIKLDQSLLDAGVGLEDITWTLVNQTDGTSWSSTGVGDPNASGSNQYVYFSYEAWGNGSDTTVSGTETLVLTGVYDTLTQSQTFYW